MTELEEAEFIRCARDPLYFAKNYWYSFIPTKADTIKVPMVPFQDEMIKFLHNNDLNLIKKSRQMYVTTTMAIYVTWNLIFKYDYSIGIVSNNMMLSHRFLNLVRRNLEKFRVGFKLEDEIVVDNKTEIRLANGSSLKAFAGNKGAGRGYTINMFIFDEAAYIKDLEYIWSGAGMATIAQKGSKIIFASTPNNAGDLFHKIWVGAKTETNDFNVIDLDWTMNPNYTKDIQIRDGKPWSPWYEEQCKRLNFNEDAIDRELNGIFVSGVRPDVPKRINFRLESEVYDKIIEKIDETGISLTDYMKDLINKDLGLD